MKLFDLMKNVPFTGITENLEISRVTSDSRQITPGCLFVCIAGARFDGHSAAEQVLKEGAAAVVCERDLGLDQQLLVEDSREAYGILCSNFYGNPAQKMKLIGITGTNGKTTCTYLIKHILESAGKKVGLIGTIHNEIGDMVLPAKNTTPDPGELHVLFMRMAQAGCEYVVMETSSHALDQKRLAGCRFAVGVFTNLTQDHLDYHGTMENYYQAKKKLFDLSDAAVINIDDEYGRRLTQEIPCPAITFSIHTDTADFTAKDIRPTVDRNRFTIVGNAQIGRVSFSMPGEFSVANAMAAGVIQLSWDTGPDRSAPHRHGFHGDSGLCPYTGRVGKGAARFKAICQKPIDGVVWMSRREGSVQAHSHGRSSGKVCGLYHPDFR